MIALTWGLSYERSEKDVSFPAGNSGICNDKKVLIIASKARGCNGCVEHDFNMQEKEAINTVQAFDVSWQIISLQIFFPFRFI